MEAEHVLELANVYNPKTEETTIKASCPKCGGLAYRVLDFGASDAEYTSMAVSAFKELAGQACK